MQKRAPYAKNGRKVTRVTDTNFSD